MKILWLLLAIIARNCVAEASKKMLLEEVQVLTLYSDRMTTSRRTNAVPQAKCVGGSAGCHAFKPQVVQCYNRGSDGYDVQWECKTDMDNAYRFGRVEVICEGYDHSEDRYILRGSCGMEYTLDFTKEGHSQKENSHHDYYGNQNSDSGYSSSYKKQSSGFGDLIIIIVVGIVIYAIYKTCLSQPQHQYSTANSDYPGGDNSYPTNQGYPPGTPGGGGWFGNMFGGSGATNAPPYGFRQEHHDAGCGGARQHQPRNNFGGFWSGAASGGLLGYMFGARNNDRHSSSAYTHHRPTFTSSSYDSNRAFGGTSNQSPSSSGTRTASGFGGTRRR